MQILNFDNFNAANGERFFVVCKSGKMFPAVFRSLTQTKGMPNVGGAMFYVVPDDEEIEGYIPAIATGSEKIYVLLKNGNFTYCDVLQYQNVPLFTSVKFQTDARAYWDESLLKWVYIT